MQFLRWLLVMTLKMDDECNGGRCGDTIVHSELPEWGIL
jgi:hypothetical protein